MAGRNAAGADVSPQVKPGDVSSSPVSLLAAEIKRLVVSGERDEARERFGALVALLQRRALRVAFQYLRNPADADEAVQDAFIKVFLHIEQYRDDLPFDVWFTRILVNASLDRLKARTRQERLVTPVTDEQMTNLEAALKTAADTAAQQSAAIRANSDAIAGIIPDAPPTP